MTQRNRTWARRRLKVRPRSVGSTTLETSLVWVEVGRRVCGSGQSRGGSRPVKRWSWMVLYGPFDAFKIWQNKRTRSGQWFPTRGPTPCPETDSSESPCIRNLVRSSDRPPSVPESVLSPPLVLPEQTTLIESLHYRQLKIYHEGRGQGGNKV